MKIWGCIFLLMLAANLAVSGQTQNSNKSKVEQKLIRLKLDWGKAYVKRDAAMLERIIADEYTVTDENGATTAREAIIADFKNSSAIYDSAVYEDAKVRIYGDTAIVAGRGTVKGRGKTTAFHTQYFSTNVFVKRDGRWQAVATHISGVKRL